MDPGARRETIRQAAAQAFAETRYEAVSLAAVAAQAGVSEALVHKYFGTKAGLYAEVVGGLVSELLGRQQRADAEMGPNVSARDRVRTALGVYLDFVTDHQAGWVVNVVQVGPDAQPVADLRRRTREAYVGALRQAVGGVHGVRDEFALCGYLGFVDAACLSWVERGCPQDQRWPLIEAALGCLEGALGDWRC